ncbi:Heavy metal-associated isoprenylated plant protein 7 [Sesamum angolense]|uniref:Heavy metal-associated isoprenylated plant protein 7 n=1 Tax=Sesamum angolense TaxID=2727404 RepID=A0AAE2BV22_9LAMI|nr:Heavy metal-associated isoprenylated plant protein 7 [Sesamum angolense]
MGEEKKEVGNATAAEEKKEEVKKEEEKKDDEVPPPPEIVLKVDMHCEACARKVARALKGFEGVEEVTAEYKTSKVVVKGKDADPVKVCQRIQKKSGRKVEIISPLPNPPHQNDHQQNKEKEEPKEEKKEEPPAVITVVLKVRMHCDACAHALQKRIGKIQGVESVTTDIANDQVIVKGVLDPEKLVSDVYKRTGKQASIVKNEEKKEEEKKDEEKKDEKQDDKKEGEESKEEDDKKTDVKKIEYWPPKYYMEHIYAPQMFSDENPNACSVMSGPKPKSLDPPPVWKRSVRRQLVGPSSVLKDREVKPLGYHLLKKNCLQIAKDQIPNTLGNNVLFFVEFSGKY